MALVLALDINQKGFIMLNVIKITLKEKQAGAELCQAQLSLDS